MATYDRWSDEITCQCDAAVTVHWVDRAYRTADPEIDRVVGPAIKRRHKSGRFLDKDCVDVLCGRCGAMLHESVLTKKFGRSVRPSEASR